MVSVAAIVGKYSWRWCWALRSWEGLARQKGCLGGGGAEAKSGRQHGLCRGGEPAGAVKLSHRGLGGTGNGGGGGGGAADLD